MESDDEFNEFVMNELIDPSSLDEEHDLFFGAAQMIIEESVNNPGRIGSVQGHEVVHRDRLLWHNLLYKDYFSDIQRLEQTSLDAGSHVLYNVYVIFMCHVL